MDLREALISLSYREVKPEVWCKPVGYHFFLVREKIARWENWFRNVKGDLSTYDVRSVVPVDGMDYLRAIKECEAYTRINVGDGTSQFQLSAIDL